MRPLIYIESCTGTNTDMRLLGRHVKIHEHPNAHVADVYKKVRQRDSLQALGSPKSSAPNYAHYEQRRYRLPTVVSY